MATVIAIGLGFASATSLAAAQPMSMPMMSAQHDPQLLRAFVDAGGRDEFRTATFVATMAAQQPQEARRLQQRFGLKTIAMFERVLEFAVDDSKKTAGTQATTGTSGDLGVALYRAGLGSSGTFNVERLFDVVFGHDTHVRVMGDVATRFGGPGEAAYHQVLTALVTDVGRKSDTSSVAMPKHDMAAMDDVHAAPSPASMNSSMPMGSMPMGASPSPAAAGMSKASSPPMPMTSGMPMNGMKMGDDMKISAGMSMPMNAGGVMSMYGMSKMHMSDDKMSMQSMPGITDLGSPMSREGSGTAWLPDSSTTFGHMSTRGDNMLMTHGAGFVRYSDTFTDRGSRTLNAPDWYALMGSHPLSPASQLGARIMVTSDFATVGGFGYPELYQSGESYQGEPLHDHQHPHDLFSEAALTYSTQMSRNASAYLYVGYPGEPALGPPTFMHRLIAYDMPDAPIGHHWEDSTHITFGVVTAGVSLGRVKFEGSTFTGREPNEVRTNFDPISLDSVSGRVSWNPTANLATQVSFGYIKSPEALTPLLDQHRTTASIIYNKPLGLGQFFTTSAVWGQNYESDNTRSNAYLLEADYHRSSDSVYTRAEFVQKSGNELVLDANPTQLAVSPDLAETLFPIGAYTVSYVHDFRSPHSGTVTGLGGQVTFNTRPGALTPFYGSATPWGFELFARVRPSALR